MADPRPDIAPDIAPDLDGPSRGDGAPPLSGATGEADVLRAAHDNSVDGVFVFEVVRDGGSGRIVEFRWTYANEAGARILGRPREWFAGRLLTAEFPGTIVDGLFGAFALIVEGGASWAREVTYRHEDLDVHLRLAACKAGDGLALTFVDLTERWRSEEALRQEEHRWRAILETIPQIVWSARADGFHDFFNGRWYQFTGIQHGTTDGDGWAGMFHPEDQPTAWERWRHSLATGAPYEVEYRLRHHSGDWRWVLGRALPMRDRHGRITRWFGTCTDIEDIKRTGASLVLSEERLQLALEAAEVVGTWDWNITAGRIVADARIARLYGFEPEEGAAGIGIDTFIGAIHPDDREMVAEGIQAAIDSGERCVLEYRLLRPDGSVAWVTGRGQCHYDADGRAVRLPGAAIDVTERRRLEEERKLLAGELSHRIKNVFAVVSGLVAMTGRSDPAARDLVDRLRARINALAVAHGSVGDFSDGTAGKGSIRKLAAAIVAPYDDDADPRIRISGSDARIGVHTATGLSLVFHELATNAIKYGSLSSLKGGIDIDWAQEDDVLRISWREHGGPPINDPPTRRGFGSLMTERVAKAQLDADVEHGWRREGLEVVLRVPLTSLAR